MTIGDPMMAISPTARRFYLLATTALAALLTSGFQGSADETIGRMTIPYHYACEGALGRCTSKLNGSIDLPATTPNTFQVYTTSEIDAKVRNLEDTIKQLETRLGQRIETQNNVISDVRQKILDRIDKLPAELILNEAAYQAFKERLKKDLVRADDVKE
jgi:hypothetical protein